MWDKGNAAHPQCECLDGETLYKTFQELEKVILVDGAKGEDQMKNGKKPNRKQQEALQKAGLRSENWLIVKNLEKELHVVNRSSNKLRVIPA